jgi:hypothetical protein
MGSYCMFWLSSSSTWVGSTQHTYSHPRMERKRGIQALLSTLLLFWGKQFELSHKQTTLHHTHQDRPHIPFVQYHSSILPDMSHKPKYPHSRTKARNIQHTPCHSRKESILRIPPSHTHNSPHRTFPSPRNQHTSSTRYHSAGWQHIPHIHGYQNSNTWASSRPHISARCRKVHHQDKQSSHKHNFLCRICNHPHKWHTTLRLCHSVVVVGRPHMYLYRSSSTLASSNLHIPSRCRTVLHQGNSEQKERQ